MLSNTSIFLISVWLSSTLVTGIIFGDTDIPENFDNKTFEAMAENILGPGNVSDPIFGDDPDFDENNLMVAYKGKAGNTKCVLLGISKASGSWKLEEGKIATFSGFDEMVEKLKGIRAKYDESVVKKRNEDRRQKVAFAVAGGALALTAAYVINQCSVQ